MFEKQIKQENPQNPTQTHNELFKKDGLKKLWNVHSVDNNRAPYLLTLKTRLQHVNQVIRSKL